MPKKTAVILHDEVGCNIERFIKNHFPETKTYASYRIDLFIDKIKSVYESNDGIDLVIVELTHDYRDLSGVRDKIDSPLHLIKVLKQLGIENIIAHSSTDLGKPLELKAMESGAKEYMIKETADNIKKAVIGKYLGQ